MPISEGSCKRSWTIIIWLEGGNLSISVNIEAKTIVASIKCIEGSDTIARTWSISGWLNVAEITNEPVVGRHGEENDAGIIRAWLCGSGSSWMSEDNICVIIGNVDKIVSIVVG